MIIPQYWAEGRVKGTAKGRRVTIRRFGWSDLSEEDAQLMADVRAEDAFNALAGGANVVRREPKVSYNGAEGVPIREEVLERHGETVITRNIYGARCLNTPNVLFADIDFSDAPSFAMYAASFVILLGIAIVVGVWSQSFGVGVIAVFAALAFTGLVARTGMHLRSRATGGPEQRARKRLESFVSSHPDWHVRLYRTPAGFRVLALHRTFDPHEPEVAEFFSALETDPVYVRMCLNQRCFRARLTPKPWRIGIEKHIKPHPGVWPIRPERLPDRHRWVADYENKAQGYAACQFIESLGAATTDPYAKAVQDIHDSQCRATSGLPIA